MTEKKVLKAEGVGELIGGVTALLGYIPTHSLVIAPFVGSRAHSALRIDLHTDPEPRAQMVATAMGITCRVTGVTGFAAVVYTDGTEAEHQALASDLLLAAEYIGLNVIELAYVTPHRLGRILRGHGEPSGHFGRHGTRNSALAIRSSVSISARWTSPPSRQHS